MPDETAGAPKETTEHTEAAAPARRSYQRILPWLILLVAAGILVAIIAGWNVWVGGRATQTTDDAYLRSDITPLSTKVSGTVQLVAVADYQRVKAGDLLVQLKDDDFKAQVVQAEAEVGAAGAALENNARQKELQAAKIMEAQAGLESARADLAQAKAAVDASQAQVADAQANVEAAAAQAEQSLLERRRQEALVNDRSATKQNLEQVVANQERFAATLSSRKAEVAQARAEVALRQAEQQRAVAQISSKSAELDAQKKETAVLDAQESQLKADLKAKHGALRVAETNLQYTQIVAPSDGMVGERKVRVGQLVSPGTQVISLVENTVWVQANYKETQLRNVTSGDEAEVTVDAFPGVVLRGHVEELSPASGSQFALLPPDNATGNFTKIVQRIPVKIVLEVDPAVAERLRPGMSVIAAIKTRQRRMRDAGNLR
jgi:membrane fusion protein (multidrug efflux system)